MKLEQYPRLSAAASLSRVLRFSQLVHTEDHRSQVPEYQLHPGGVNGMANTASKVPRGVYGHLYLRYLRPCEEI
jgi:hypothetical protein